MKVELTDYQVKLLIDTITIALPTDRSNLYLDRETLRNIACRLEGDIITSCTEFVNKTNTGDIK